MPALCSGAIVGWSVVDRSREATMTVEETRREVMGANVGTAAGETLKALSFRTRVAVLWLAVAVALASSMLLGLVEPGAIEEMLGGEIEGEPLTEAVGFQLAVLLIIPLAMVAVTLLVGDRVNRYVNLMVALGYGLFGSFLVVSEIAGGHFNGHVLMAVVACVLGFLIAAVGLIGIRHSDRPGPRT